MSTSDLRPSNRPLPLPHPRRVCRVANYPAGPANCGILIQTLSSPLSSPPSNPNPSTPISCTQAYTLPLARPVFSAFYVYILPLGQSLTVYGMLAMLVKTWYLEVGWFSNSSHSCRESVEVGSPTELPCLIGNMRAANHDKFTAIFMNSQHEHQRPKLTLSHGKCFDPLLLSRSSYISKHGKMVKPNQTFPLRRSNKIKASHLYK